MKPFLFFFCLFAFSVNALELHSGDVILISFNCYECRVIEDETNSAFSHSGVIVKNENGETFVAQALVKVQMSPLKDFLKNITPGTQAFVYRPFELENTKNILSLEKGMRDIFDQNFKGLPFDSSYLWNNFDKEGRELLYCSEFVAKFLDHFLSTPSLLFPLSFSKNYAYWLMYFKGNIPEGVMGNSPFSFSIDSRFHLIGTLD
jgi:hypothetical protein